MEVSARVAVPHATADMYVKLLKYWAKIAGGVSGSMLLPLPLVVTMYAVSAASTTAAAARAS
jgi:hypothetical protein